VRTSRGEDGLPANRVYTYFCALLHNLYELRMRRRRSVATPARPHSAHNKTHPHSAQRARVRALDPPAHLKNLGIAVVVDGVTRGASAPRSVRARSCRGKSAATPGKGGKKHKNAAAYPWAGKNAVRESPDLGHVRACPGG